MLRKPPARLLRALVVVLLGAACPLLAAGAALAFGTPKADAKVLARTLRPGIAAKYKAVGDTVTGVDCTLTASQTSGHCTASFTTAAGAVRGTFAIRVTIDTRSGAIGWQAYAVSCHVAKTGAGIAC